MGWDFLGMFPKGAGIRGSSSSRVWDWYGKLAKAMGWEWDRGALFPFLAKTSRT